MVPNPFTSGGARRLTRPKHLARADARIPRLWTRTAHALCGSPCSAQFASSQPDTCAWLTSLNAWCESLVRRCMKCLERDHYSAASRSSVQPSLIRRRGTAARRTQRERLARVGSCKRARWCCRNSEHLTAPLPASAEPVDTQLEPRCSRARRRVLHLGMCLP
jgi:hypothetical protein